MRFRRSALLSVVSFVVAGLSGACSAARSEADSVGASESSETIHLDGDELFVRSPVGPAAARFVLKRMERRSRSTIATRLKAGDYILTLDADLGDSNAWAGATAPTTQRATVHVTAKQTTLFNLAALKLGLDVPSPDEGDINVTPVADLRVEYVNPDAGKHGPPLHRTAASRSDTKTRRSAARRRPAGKAPDVAEHEYCERGGRPGLPGTPVGFEEHAVSASSATVKREAFMVGLASFAR